MRPDWVGRRRLCDEVSAFFVSFRARLPRERDVFGVFLALVALVLDLELPDLVLDGAHAHGHDFFGLVLWKVEALSDLARQLTFAAAEVGAGANTVSPSDPIELGRWHEVDVLEHLVELGVVHVFDDVRVCGGEVEQAAGVSLRACST